MNVNSALKPIFNLSKLRTVLVAFSRLNSSENILKSPHSDVEIPRLTIPEFVFSKTEKWGNFVATECAITGKKYTFDQLRKYSENLAGALRKKLKLNKGNVVGILLPNSPEYAIVAIGILQGGLIATTINPSYTPAEISRQLLDSGAKAIITLADLFPVAKAAVDATKQPIHILTSGAKDGQATPEGAFNLKEMVEEKIDISDITQSTCDEIAFMPYSSGTTGLPKGVLLTHYNIISNLSQFNHPDTTYLRETTKDHQDVIPSILPHFHIYGLVATLLLTLVKGCKNVTLPKFEPKLFIETLIKHKPSVLFVAPPLVTFMSTHDAVKPEHLSEVRSVICGAAPLGALDEERLLTKAKKNIVIGQGYGMTESSPVIAITTNDMKSTAGSTGPPVSRTQVKVASLSDSSKALGPNENGELLIRGPQVMQGYHNNPKETEQTIVDDGWLRTGDIGFYDDAGCLTITDRLKELIKVKGFQVPPAELEEVIRDYPDVLEVGVIGIPHERHGQVPKAFIVVKPDTKFDQEKLKDFVKSRVASYKELRGGVQVIDNLPKNASGKILRRKLREEYEENK